jgi:predicted nicotinamide N-methyase
MSKLLGCMLRPSLFLVSADTGGDCWKGAMAMARFFKEEAKHAIVGKRILELASGTGILGLHLGLMGAKHVVMTDKESMKQLLQCNIAENDMLLASTGKCGRVQAACLVSVPVSRCCQFAHSLAYTYILSLSHTHTHPHTRT